MTETYEYRSVEIPNNNQLLFYQNLVEEVQMTWWTYLDGGRSGYHVPNVCFAPLRMVRAVSL